MAAEKAQRSRKVSPKEAARQLADRDPVVARLVADAGLPTFPVPAESHFATLVRAITYQQLAGPAARAIHGRLVTALGDDVVPQRLLALSDEELRAAGLSANKMASLRDLSAKVMDGTVVLEPRRLARVSDAEVVTRLTSVRGIGRWTAEIFLMFQLRRLDVWPTGDLGVRHGYGLAWAVPTPTAKELDQLGEQYHPYRSIVAWYCWRAVDLYGARASAADEQSAVPL
jgi:DNA-3-methyladenine glycosylase II